MPGFSFTHDMHAFEGVESITDYRFSGTYADADNYKLDTVEVMGRGIGLSWDGWRTIDRLHPLYAAAGAYWNTQDAADQTERLIRAEMAEARPRQSAIYRHAAE